nr:carbohydrate kinase family protein [Lachnospiraceae bacterium]
NFNRAILPVIKALGKPIATDVHVLSDIHDEYNKDFLKAADILFLSDEAVKDNYEEFILSIAKEYNTNIIVMGRGKKGVAYYEKADGTVRTMPIAESGNVVNTIGAGDALFSSFIHFYSKGFSVENSLAYAQKFASIKIQTNGAANGFVTEDKIL